MEDLGKQFDILNGRAHRVSANHRNIVEFYTDPYQDETLSAAQGRPIFRDVTYVRIMIPGDMRTIIERRANEDDKIKYAREWEAFRKSETLSAEGTPLEQWSILSRAMVRQLKAFSIYTVDQLAGLTDGQISDVGMLGLRTLRSQAIAFLEHAKTGAVSSKLVAEKERLESKVEQLEQAVAEANLRFETMVREHGGDASAMRAISVPSPSSQPRLPDAPQIPATTKSMSNKDVLELAERIVGIRFQTRKEAEEALAEARAEADAAK